jgi:CheY-like chemotaxis protein
LFVTGNARDDRLAPHLEHEHTALLAKPFTAAELLAAIEGLLPPEARPTTGSVTPD